MTVSSSSGASLPLVTGGRVAVNKIICIGRNYAEHVREMGNNPQDAEPIFFFKPHSALNTRGKLRYPSFTQELHHEVELVVVLQGGGTGLNETAAATLIGGFAVGLDMTCRDLQRRAKATGGPWEASKAFDGSAPCTAVQPATHEDLARLGELRLTRNGTQVQVGHPSQMIWPVPTLIARLSHYFALEAGDVIFTGTPAGVGPVNPGDRLEAHMEGLQPRLALDITAPA